MDAQKTIAKETSFSGIGVHTGNLTAITFKPAPANSGIKFSRTDLAESSTIRASVENVVGVTRGTTIAENGVEVHTVEHVLASVFACGIDNLLIELDSNEPPVGDGSAMPFVNMINKAGVVDQEYPRKYFAPKETISVVEGDIILILLPSDDFKVSYTISYEHPAIRSQYLSISVNRGTFEKEIAPSRTFCLYSEVAALMDKELIKGGSLDNAVVIGDDAIYSKEALRFKDEFVRHKILDLVGDLFLTGIRIKGHVIAVKSGHPCNVKFARLINAAVKKKERSAVPISVSGYEETILDISQIKRILPHRYPFLLVDRVIEIENDKRAVGIKNVTVNEEFFNGHFPERPVMPGVLQIEALAQLAGILMLKKTDNAGKLAFFMGIDKAKFRKPVVPGDQLRLEIEVIKMRSTTGIVSGKAYIGDELASEAELKFALVES
ncbi:bifunctional UDP-3-O-[3-hydroxymyristoyl] N-acetylglucosamine deacetylase/3-hydroxyacyl-ACP dehydratase [bacterium]|jgi:UDP-3-O-[3-hydroxymyristoyl] N-acetylglucosamine deacetylase/3-hydroxyacyl-[acyl-carrier-protein] dehydratase|nr:bifunctional UDP-3-O-[3-hydroxymyristoyl] N-acetylglucosamine deacetylase/3-hydroxyacyl-ACP dehydratase [bacterium]